LADFLTAQNLTQVWQVYQILFRIFLAVIHNKLQFKGTELEFNGTESAEDIKLPILILTATCLSSCSTQPI